MYENTITIRLDKDTHRELKQIAESEGRKLSKTVEVLINLYKKTTQKGK